MSERRMEQQVPRRTASEQAQAEMAEVDSQIAESSARLKRQRVWTLLVVVLVVVAAGSAVVVSLFTGKAGIQETRVVSGIAAGAIAVLAIAANLVAAEAMPLRRDLAVLAAKKETLGKFAVEQPYFDRLVEINVRNLGEYYALVKAHAENSFRVSLWVGLLGFALIAIGLIFGFSNPTYLPIAYISAAAGALTEFIAGVFFYLYSNTVRQMKEYHDSLLETQNVLLSFKIVDDIADPQQKQKMVEALLSYLLGKREKQQGA